MSREQLQIHIVFDCVGNLGIVKVNCGGFTDCFDQCPILRGQLRIVFLIYTHDLLQGDGEKFLCIQILRHHAGIKGSYIEQIKSGKPCVGREEPLPIFSQPPEHKNQKKQSDIYGIVAHNGHHKGNQSPGNHAIPLVQVVLRGIPQLSGQDKENQKQRGENTVLGCGKQIQYHSGKERKPYKSEELDSPSCPSGIQESHDIGKAQAGNTQLNQGVEKHALVKGAGQFIQSLYDAAKEQRVQHGMMGCNGMVGDHQPLIYGVILKIAGIKSQNSRSPAQEQTCQGQQEVLGRGKALRIDNRATADGGKAI